MILKAFNSAHFITALRGFNSVYYLGVKLAQLQATPSSGWDSSKTIDDLLTTLKAEGFTPETHYMRYGYRENLAPNAFFNAAEYIQAKANQLVTVDHRYASVEAAKAAFLAAWDGDVYQHYLRYGAAENVNPSNAFDESAYYALKLAALRADPLTSAEWTPKSVADLQRYFKNAGFTALTHYEAYGKAEGIVVTPVLSSLTPSLFNPTEYTQAKANQLFLQHAYDSVDAAKTAFLKAWNQNVYQHYLQYGAAENVNPSNAFDESAYYALKLAALRADPLTTVEWTSKSVADLQRYFKNAGFTALTHYEAYGKAEGIVVTPVPVGEKVADTLFAVTIDGAATPTVTITSSSSALKAGETATITFTFSADPGASFVATDIVTTGGTLGDLSGTGRVRTATFTPTASLKFGSASITIAVRNYTDAAGNTGSAGTTPTITIDTLAPTVAITSSTSALKAGETATITFTFSEDPGTSFVATDIVTTGGTLEDLSGTGRVRTAKFTPTANLNFGSASITIAVRNYSDTIGNTGGAGTTPKITIDTLAPTVAITSSTSALKAGETATITFTFSEDPGTSFVATDIVTTGGTLEDLSGTGRVRTAKFTPTANLNFGSASITIAVRNYSDTIGNTGGAGTTPKITIDTLAPMVVITSSASALKAGETATITFTFSEDPGTSFVATDIVTSGGTLGTLSGTGLVRTAMFTPTANLANGSASITVAAGNYAGPAGNTGSAGTTPVVTIDTLAPTLSSSIPADNAMAVLVGANIVLNFSESVTAVAGKNIVLHNVTDSTTTTIAANDAQISIVAGVVTINPTADFLNGKNYYVTVDAGAFIDGAGNDYAGIADATLLNFTITPDVTAPTLSSSIPADNAVAVAVGANIVLNFSESVTAVAGKNVVLHNVTDSTITTIAANDAQVSIVADVVIINPTADFLNGKDYYVTVDAGAFIDGAGNGYAGITDATLLNFTITPDVTAPTLSSSIPADNAVAVAVGANIVLNFSESVTAVAGKNVVLHNVTDSTTTTIAANDAQVSIVAGVVIINPTADLLNGKDYYVTVDAGAFIDGAGNGYAGIADATLLNFTITSDVTAPTLSSSIPADNALAVAVDANIVLNFSESVTAVAGKSVVLHNVTDSSTTTIAANDAQVSIVAGVVIINPTADFLNGKDYYVTVDAGAFIDGAGNSYAGIADAATLNFTTTPDVTAPTLSSSIPADNAVAVAVGANIVLNFSESVTAVAGKNVVLHNLTDSTTTTIAANDAQISIVGSVVTINPTADFLNGKNYYVTVDAGAFIDGAGNGYAGIADAVTFNFTTTPDVTAPTLSSSVPADNATAVALGTNIVLNFNESITAVAGKSVVLHNVTDSTTTTIAANDAQISIIGSVVTINPTADFLNGKDYYVTVDAGAFIDGAGNSYAGIADAATLNFTTTPDVTAPTLSSSIPADNAVAVAVGANIVLNFNESVTAVAGKSVVLHNVTDSTITTIAANDAQISIVGSVVTINPTADFLNGKDYYVTVDAGAFIDGAGNGYAGITSATALNFTTTPDVTAPTLSSSVPADNALAVALGANIVLNFSESVTAVAGKNIVLHNVTDSTITTIAANDAQISIVGSVVTINPTTDFLNGKDYFVTVDAGAFIDGAGNGYAGITSATALNFTTTPDVTAPTLSSSVPADNAVAVSVGANIVLNFNESVTAVAGKNIVLHNVTDSTTTTIAANDAQISIIGSVVTINPTANFLNGKDYYVTVDAGAFIDGAGNGYAGITSATALNFTTTPDVTAPTLSSSVPADNALAVAVGANVVLNFNESVIAVAGKNVVLHNVTDSTTTTITANDAQISIVGSVVTINPTANFLNGKDYYVTVDAGAFIDGAGNGYAGIADAVTLNFTTTPDVTAPTLSSSVPADNALAVAVGANVVLNFNESVTAVAGKNVVLHNVTDSTITTIAANDAQVSIVAGVVTINPTADLLNGKDYYVTVDTGAFIDGAGNGYAGIADPTALNFTITPDVTAPTLSSTVPADNATAVALGANIVLNFSESVTAVAGKNVVLHNVTDSTTTTIATNDAQVSIVAGVVTINPTADFLNGKDYYVTVDAGAFIDGAGNGYAGIADTVTLNFTTTPDVTAPTLSSSIPADNAAAVALGANIVLNFNESVTAVAGKNIVLHNVTDSTTTTIAANDAQISIIGSVVTINPTANFLNGKDYYVTVDAGAFIDGAGNGYAGITSATALNFTTTPDVTAPTLSSTVPADNAAAVALGANIVLNFNESVIAVAGKNVVLHNVTDSAITTIAANDAQISIVGSVVTINPTANFLNGKDYYVTVDAGAFIDGASNGYAGIADTVTLNFTTTPDVTAPTLASSIPADNAMAVLVEANIVLNFSESVTAVAGKNIVLYNMTDSAITTIAANDAQISIIGSVVTINPTADFLNGKDYYVTVDAGAFIDGAGNSYAGIADAATLNFTTFLVVPPPDLIPPTLSSSVPADNAMAVLVGANIVLNFNESVTTVAGKNVVLHNVTDSTITTIAANDAQISIVGSVVTVNPTTDFLNGKSYYVTVDAGAFIDGAGNSYAGIADPTALNFTITPDVTAPTLSSTVPADNAVAVAVGANIVLNFNESVTAVAGKNIVLHNVTDSAITTIAANDAQISIVAGVVTINPTADFLNGKDYYVSVDAGAFIDGAGNGYAGIADTVTLNFTTTPDVTAPTLASSVPADNAAAVAMGANIVLNFNESVTAVAGKNIVLHNVTDSTITTIAANDAQISIVAGVVTINPTADFLNGKDYYVTVDAGAFIDGAGNAYAGIADPTALNFTTTPDVTAPTLASSVPTDNAAAVAVGANIVLNFNESVTAVAGKNIVLHNVTDSTTTTIAANDAQISIVAGVVTINPTADFLNGKDYYVTVDAGAFIDGAGNGYTGIANAATLNFTTTPDVTAPTLSSSIPADNAVAVAVGANIVLNFSESVTAVAGKNIVLHNVTDSAITTIAANDAQVSIIAGVVTINPAADFLNGKNYYVTVDAGAFIDGAGNGYAGIADPTALNFTTTPDVTAPTLASSVPTDNAAAVAVGANIVLNFNESVTAVAGKNVVLHNVTDSTTTTIAANDAQISIVGSVVTINPTADFLNGKDYYVTVDAGAFIDGAGNSYAGIADVATLNFTTTPDVTAPTLSSSVPADNAAAVAVGANIVLNFNESVTAVAGKNVVLHNVTDSTITTIAANDAQISIVAGVVTINPTADLLNGKDYYVTVDAGAFIDGAGNAYAGIADPTALNFTTTPDVTAPTLSSTVPADNAAAVALGANIVLNFNESVTAVAGKNVVLHNVTDSAITTIAANDAQVSIIAGVVTINPAADFLNGKNYYVTVDAGAFIDGAGNGYAGIADTVTLNFTTTPDVTAPMLSSSVPADNAAAVALGANIVLNFSESVTAVAGKNIVLHNVTDSTTTTITANDAQVSIVAGIVTINPTTDFLNGKDYYVTVDAGAFIDGAGNGYAGIADTVTLNFTTTPDVTAPMLSSSVPADNAAAVALGANIVLNFSESVTAVAGKNIVLHNVTDSTTTTIAANDAQISIVAGVVTINPTTDFLNGKNYYVTVDSGAFIDGAGNGYTGITDPTALNFTTTPDVTAPTLSSSVPADNAAAVAVGANIVLNFNESVTAVAGKNIVLHNVTDSTITTIAANDAQISIVAGVVTINPTADFLNGKDYYVTVDAGAFIDGAGNGYAGIADAATLNFTTTPDVTAPTLSSSVPADNALSVALGANIVLNFNESVTAVAGKNIVLHNVTDSTTTTIAANDAKVSIVGGVVTINPTADFLNGKNYYVTVDAGAFIDGAGNGYAGIADAATLNFTTTPDVTAPMLSSSVPADNAAAVAVGANIVLNFNESVTAVAGKNIVLHNVTDSTTNTIAANDTQVSIVAGVVTINPTADFLNGKNYYVTVDAGAFIDGAGNGYAGMADTTLLNFTTTPDVTAPTLSSSVPADNATAVALGANIVLNFSESVTAVAGKSVVLHNVTDSITTTIAANDAQVSIVAGVVIINPTADFLNGKDYYVTVDAGAFIDGAGNNYAGIADAATLNFTTTPDVTAPTLSSSIPADNALSVAVGANIVLNFNESVTAVAGKNVVLHNVTDSTTTTIAANDAQISIMGSLVTINPTADFLNGKDYYVTVDAGAFIDGAGNGYAGIADPTLLNFITAPDVTAPTLTSSVPADNATAVSVEDNIVLNFSENVLANTGYIVLKATADNAIIESFNTATGQGNHGGTVTVTGVSVTVDPMAYLTANTGYYVTVDSTAVKDVVGNNYAGIVSSTELNFTTPTPTSYNLTTFADIAPAFVGTVGDDIFNGTYGDGAGPYTLDATDVLNGGTGVDTLSITTGAEASTPPDSLWANKTNFEKVEFHSTGAGAQSITTGVNFNTAFAGHVDLIVETYNGATTIEMQAFDGTSTLVATTTLDGAQTITTSNTHAAIVKAINSAAGAQTISGQFLTEVQATINGAGAQTIGNALGGGSHLINVTATVLGAGDQTITTTSTGNATVNATCTTGTQRIVTGVGNDSVTAHSTTASNNVITTDAGNDTIIAGQGNDSITGGLGSDSMTGGGGTDTFVFGANGSIVGASMDIITDFNNAGADILTFGGNTTVLAADASVLVAGTNVQTSDGGLITFDVSDNTLAFKIAAVEADAQLDVAGSVAMFVDSGNTYLYYAGIAAGNLDDQVIQLTGITTFITITGGPTTTII
uniref:Ig-like domain-containing protein n=1 Tax=Chlorobium chlorochromatii (strain CaD3) TaxID=340177 RepID=Q3AT73_CHLCH